MLVYCQFVMLRPKPTKGDGLSVNAGIGTVVHDCAALQQVRQRVQEVKPLQMRNRNWCDTR